MRCIESLASRNSTKNTDFKRKKLADILDKGQMSEVKAKLDTVYNPLKKHVSFVEGIEAGETSEENEDERDVNFISGTGFQNQRLGNQQGNRSFNHSLTPLFLSNDTPCEKATINTMELQIFQSHFSSSA